MKIEEINALLEDIDLNGQPPSEEPARQYYYLKKCRSYVEAEEKKLGRKLTACVTTFGCQMNARDSEKLSGIRVMCLRTARRLILTYTIPVRCAIMRTSGYTAGWVI